MDSKTVDELCARSWNLAHFDHDLERNGQVAVYEGGNADWFVLVCTITEGKERDCTATASHPRRGIVEVLPKADAVRLRNAAEKYCKT